MTSSQLDDGIRRTSADRILALLVVMADYPHGARLQELAGRLDAPKATVHRGLATLQRAGLVTQGSNGLYRLGWQFLRLAFSFYERLDLVAHVRPVLARLAETFGETAHFAALDGAEVVYLAKVQSAKAKFQLTSAVGGRNPAHCTGVGKVLLAHLLPDRHAVQLFVDAHGPLERRTEHSIVEVDPLHQELQTIRSRGFALACSENEPGINCLALPVFITSTTRPDGAISVSTVAQRVSLDDLLASLSQVQAIVSDGLDNDVWHAVSSPYGAPPLPSARPSPTGDQPAGRSAAGSPSPPPRRPVGRQPTKRSHAPLRQPPVPGTP